MPNPPAGPLVVDAPVVDSLLEEPRSTSRDGRHRRNPELVPARFAVRRAKRPPRITVTGVLGELLMTVGVLVLAFVGWKFYLMSYLGEMEQAQGAQDFSAQLAEAAQNAPAPDEVSEDGIPVRTVPTEQATEFGVLYVPRFGDGWSRSIAEGIDRHEVIDHYLGHYPTTGAPGSEGTFALAGHRTTGVGGPFFHITDLRLGDKLYVETVDGWYVYEFRSGEYVQPEQVDVLNPVPRVPDAFSGDRLMVLTSCNPRYSAAERVIAYAVFDGFVPRASGAPAEIAASVAQRDEQGGL